MVVAWGNNIKEYLPTINCFDFAEDTGSASDSSNFLLN